MPGGSQARAGGPGDFLSVSVKIYPPLPYFAQH